MYVRNNYSILQKYTQKKENKNEKSEYAKCITALCIAGKIFDGY